MTRSTMGGGGGGSVTVSVVVPDFPSTDAVIVVEPPLTPLARPDALMVATKALLLDQLKVLPDMISLSES